ncbi:MAG: 50S ribosomal protein L20 [Chlamydiales bacterium]|nr:50S ribosomal protein L20 [Chlamydiales bacterium]
MARVTCAPASRKRRKRLLKRAKGFFGDRKNHTRQTSNAVMSALAFNTRHRKLKKRDFRSLWITRIGVGAKLGGISYSKLINGLKRANCDLNRKMLSEMAIHDPEGFQAVVECAKKALV